MMTKMRGLLVIALAVLAAIGLQVSPSLTQQELPNQIVMGGPISLSGTYAKEGSQGLWGFQVAEKWVNEVYGGVLIGGRLISVKYVYYDDESKKENVTSLLERLITVDGVKFLFAPYSSGLTLAGAPVAEQYQALYNSHGGASDRIFEQGYQYAVQTIVPGTRYQVDTFDMMRALDPAATKVALLFEDDEFSRTVRQGALAYATSLGFNIVFDRTYPSKVPDLTPALTEMAATNPDFLVGGGHFADGQLLAKQIGDLGIALKAASIVVAPTLPAFGEALGNQANGFIGPAHWEIGVRFSRATTPAYFGPTQDWFINTFRQISGGVDPDYHGAEAAAAIFSYVLGIEKAQSLDTLSVRQAMGDLQFTSFYGDWGIDETGKQIAHKSVLIQWQNGKKEIVWPAEAQTATPCYPMASCPGR